MNASIAAMSGREKRALLGRLLAERGDLAPRPLSFSQERLFFLEYLAPGTPLYNIATVILVPQAFDAALLDRALQEIVRRHEVLRTGFALADGRPVQIIRSKIERILNVSDLRHLSPGEQEKELERLAVLDGHEPFDFRKPPLARARLVLCASERSYFFWTIHHMISDEWSAAIFWEELFQLYIAFSRGQPSPLPELRLQFADYAAWQRQHLRGEALERLLSYWRKRLQGAPQLLELPSDKPRPKRSTFRGGIVVAALDDDATKALIRLCKTEGVTLFMALQAAFAFLLHRYTGSTDIVVGTPIANRGLAGTGELIGFFVNTLVLRNDLSGYFTFRQLLARTREVTLEAYDYQDLPFERLVEELQPIRSAAYNPLFQVMFVLQDSVLGQASQPRPTAAEPWIPPAGNGTSKFDLTLFADPSAGIMNFGWEYSVDLFHATTIERMAAHYCSLVKHAAAAPDAPMSSLPLMSEDERSQWRLHTSGPVVDVPKISVSALVEASTAKFPCRDALISGDVVLSYEKLNGLANAVARRLLSFSEIRGTPVALMMPRSWQAAVVALAILKTGCPYLPLDPSYPPSRIRFMIEDSGSTLVLTTGGARISDISESVRFLPFDLEADSAAQDNLPPVSAEALAYLMYTSGSTGRPKGVCMPQRSMVNLLLWQAASEQRPLRTLQFAPLSFDVAFQEIFSTWTAGGALVVCEDFLRQNFSRLWDAVVDHSIQRLFLPYIALQALAEAAVASGRRAPDLELVITAGEQLYITTAIAALFSSFCSAELRNQYGPTETHVVTEHRLCYQDSWPQRPPIGRPIPNTTVQILDAEMNPSPTGVPGSIYVGGVAVAEGYCRAPELTAASFIEIGGSGLLYRTGDRGRLLHDGSIEFLGREDAQVKIRGIRVEPEEARSVLLQHTAVAEAIVIPQKTLQCGSRLIGYFTLREGADIGAGALREWCLERLPDYLVPSLFVKLAAMPLTPSGKLSVQDLPPVHESGHTAIAAILPLTEAETSLLEITKELLELPVVHPNADFFALGGNSLLAMRFLTKIRTRFAVDIPIQFLFDNPSLRALAARIVADKSQENLEPSELLLAKIEAMTEDEAANYLRTLSQSSH